MLGFYLSMLETDEQKRDFKKLYELYRHDMYEIAYSIVKNQHDAEDAVHNSFVRIANVFKKIQTSVAEDKIKPYISVMAKNAAIDIYNFNKNNKGNEAQLSRSETEKNLTEDDLFEKFETESLDNALKKLPQIYRDALYLHFIYGFSVKEYAKSLDINVENAYKRIGRAKAMLAEILGIDADISDKERGSVSDEREQIETGVGIGVR